jgi:hypothetical protein
LGFVYRQEIEKSQSPKGVDEGPAPNNNNQNVSQIQILSRVAKKRANPAG